MNRGRLYMYLLLAAIVIIGGYSAQFISVETDLEGYSLASQEDQDHYQDIQSKFQTSGSGETILILEKKNGWTSYNDFVELQDITKRWEYFSAVESANSIVTILYPKKGMLSTQKGPFLDVSSEESFLKRYSKLDKYQDITEKFISDDSKYVLLFLRMKKGERLNDELIHAFETSSVTDDIKFHYLQYDVLQNEVEELVKSDSFWLAILSVLLILTSFFLLTRSLSGLLLIGLMVLFNISCTVLFMVALGLPFTIHTVTVPCIIIVLSFTDLMHMMYYQRTLIKDCTNDTEIQRKIIDRIQTPMLVTSLTNIVGFIIFLILSENQLLFNFALISIVGVAIAFLSSRFIAIRLMSSKSAFLKKSESERLNKIHEWISIRVKNRKTIALSLVGLIGIAVIFGAITKFRIDGFESDFLDSDSPQLEASRILQDEFFGSKQLEVIVRSNDSNLLGVDHLNRIEAVEREIESVFQPNYINSLPTAVKRYNRFIRNGHPGAFTIPKQLNESTKGELLSFMNELGGNGILSEKRDYTKIVFGYQDQGLNASRAQYKELENRMRKFQGDLSFELSGRRYIADQGAYHFTWKIMIGLGLGILFSSILTFIVIRSIRKSLALILVNLLPVLIALLVMLWIGISITPVALFFLSLLAGICVDDSVYIVTQKKGETNQIQKFPIFVTSVVMAIGFIALGFSSFNWVRPFAWVFLIGLAVAYLLDMFILPLFYNRSSNFDADA